MSRLTSSQAKSLIEAYQSIYNTQEQVNENELALEIFEEISYTLISQGQSAVDVLEYFSNVDEEVIIEDITALSDGSLIVESVVSDEYIEEQFQQLDEVIGAALRIGQAAVKAAKYAPQGVKLGQRALSALSGAGKAATRIGQQGIKKSSVVRSGLSKAVSKVKDAAKGALSKLPGGSGGKIAGALKTAGKWALGGAAFEAGSRGVKALMGDKNKPSTTTKPSTSDGGSVKDLAAYKAGGGAAKSKQTGMSTREIEELGRKNIARKPKESSSSPSSSSTPSGGSGGGGGSTTSSTPSPKPAPKPAPKSDTKPDSGDSKLTDMQKWQKAHPKLADKVKPGQAGYDEISAMRTKPGPNEKQDQTPTSGPEASETQKSEAGKDVENFLKGEQEKMKSKQEQDKKKVESSSTKSESYDAYDILLDYLFENGHVETLDEAHYVMLEMDSETIQSIVETDLSEGKKKFPQERVRKQAVKHEGDYLNRPESSAGKQSLSRARKMKAISSTVSAGDDPRKTMHGQDLRKLGKKEFR